MWSKILKGITTGLQLLPLILDAIAQVQKQFGQASGETKKALVASAVEIGRTSVPRAPRILAEGGGVSDDPDLSYIVSQLIDASVQTLKKDPAVPEFPASKTDLPQPS